MRTGILNMQKPKITCYLLSLNSIIPKLPLLISDQLTYSSLDVRD